MIRPDPFPGWLDALEKRHLADLRPAEVARALRALSSCYVERRAKLSTGGALDSAGKRAAFALFYGPIHFLVVRNVLRAVAPALASVKAITDIGCGTGVAGAAWALETGARVTGIDRHPWAVAEANRTYRDLGISGRALRGDATRGQLQSASGAGIVAAYALNELPSDARSALLGEMIDAQRDGAQVLILEPIARRAAPWWAEWQRRFAAAGGRADEWRFQTVLPERQRQLARAAGLEPRELTARTLILPPFR